jgi:hypothetical protein
MFCNRCGSEMPDCAKFCFACGQAQQEVTPTLPNETLENETTYAPFVFRLLCSSFVFAACIFDFSQLAIQKAPAINYLRPILLAVVGLWIAYAARHAWSSLLRQEAALGSVSLQKHKKIRKPAIIIGLVFLSIAGLFGYRIGESRFELKTLNIDLAEYRTLGDNVSKFRSRAGATVSDYIQMYETIEGDTNALDRNVSKLIPELSKYKNDFPEYSTQTEQSIRNVENTRRRLALIHQQIELAKKLKRVEDTEQSSAWKEEMIPLLEQEDKLDQSAVKP